MIIFSKRKKQSTNISTKMVKETPKREIDPSKIKTITFDGLHQEEQLSFEVLENNGGILKLDDDDFSLVDVYHGASFSKLDSNAFLSAEYGIGEYESCVNRNHLCIIGREGIGGNFYIDVNNISKIDVNVYIGNGVEKINDETSEKYNLVIYTKDGSKFDKLDYEISFGKDVEKFINVIKRLNNSVTVKYEYTICMISLEYHSMKYDLTNSLKIAEYAICYNGEKKFLSDSIDFEKNINYLDISNTDVSNNNVIIHTKQNSRYNIIFENNEEAINFNNEIKKHL